MNRRELRTLIEQVGIVPVIRASSADEARFAAEVIAQSGIPIVEITLTVPSAVEVIADLVKTSPHIVVGAGTVLDANAARQCADAGANFLVSPGFDAPTVAAAREMDLLIMAGALTPGEVIAAWKLGADFVKVFPCGNVGGPAYIRALKGPLPQVPLVPTGGVTLENAADYIRAGAVALGVGGELMQKEAIRLRNAELLRGLAKEFVEVVRNARDSAASVPGRTVLAR